MESLLLIKRPEDLFSGNLVTAKNQYHELAKKWHPDVNKTPEASQIFQHISMLYDRAVEKISSGEWEGSGVLVLSDTAYPYYFKRTFELGTEYVGDDHVTFVIDKKYEPFYQNFVRAENNFLFSSPRMRTEMGRFLPSIKTKFKTDAGNLGIQLKKSPTMVLLRDIHNHYGGSLDPRHVAWIISSLLNICCYLSFSRRTNNDISLDTYFIDPVGHGGALLGGWWYSVPIGERLHSISTRTNHVLPWDVRIKKKAMPSTDLELTRLVGRELLGKKKAPAAMERWLNSPANVAAVVDYDVWSNEVLLESFGARRFVRMNLTPETLYRKET